MRFILDFAPNTSNSAIDAYLERHGCTVVRILENLGLIYLVESAELPPLTDDLESVIEDAAEGVTLLAAELKEFDVQAEDNWWKIAVIPGLDLDADTAQIMRLGQGVRVYLLDSGIDASHPEFVGKDITLLHSKTGEFRDTTGHGTALASVFVGETCGITEGSLKIVKVFHKGAPTLVSELLAAFDAVIADFSTDPNHPAVLNLSWAISKNDYIENKIRVLIERGVLVFAAAGNDGTPIPNVTPGAMMEVVTVGAFGPDLTPSDFTNYTSPASVSYTAGGTNVGVGLDMFAPGEQIRVATVGGGFGYSLGTSIATAIAAACAVVGLAAENATYDQLRYELAMNFVKSFRVMKNLLALEGVYENSPNIIPQAKMKKFDSDSDPLPIVHPMMVAKGGETFKRVIYNNNYFSGAELVSSSFRNSRIEGNWLIAEAPSVMIRTEGEVVFRVWNDEVSEIITLSIMIYNGDMFPSQTEALQNSNYQELFCECPPGALCCDACTKGACGNCVFEVCGG